MPLMENLQPLGFGEHDPSTVQLNEPHSLHTQRSDNDSEYGEFDSFNDVREEDRDIEGSTLSPSRSMKVPKTPVLPQRSDKRVPKMLESVLLELKSMDGSAPEKELEQRSIVSDPHELYLSSEEDGSFSDDYDDSLIDFEASPFEDGEENKPSSRASSRASQEDTARVVSFTLVGKPQIIDIFLPPSSASRAQMRHSLGSSSPKSVRPPSTHELFPSSIRPLSISSIPSITSSYSQRSNENQSLVDLSLRKSSKLASLITSTKTSLQHSFLSSDPFAAHEASGSIISEEDEEVTERPATPKSPTIIAWRKSFHRTLSKARKPSMPKLSLAYTAGVVNARGSKANLLASEPASPETTAPTEENEDAKQMEMQMAIPAHATLPHPGPLRYEDIMKNVLKAPPIGPAKERKKTLGSIMGLGMGLTRRSSVKVKGDK